MKRAMSAELSHKSITMIGEIHVTTKNQIINT